MQNSKDVKVVLLGASGTKLFYFSKLTKKFGRCGQK